MESYIYPSAMSTCFSPEKGLVSSAQIDFLKSNKSSSSASSSSTLSFGVSITDLLSLCLSTEAHQFRLGPSLSSAFSFTQESPISSQIFSVTKQQSSKVFAFAIIYLSLMAVFCYIPAELILELLLICAWQERVDCSKLFMTCFCLFLRYSADAESRVWLIFSLSCFLFYDLLNRKLSSRILLFDCCEFLRSWFGFSSPLIFFLQLFFFEGLYSFYLPLLSFSFSCELRTYSSAAYSFFLSLSAQTTDFSFCQRLRISALDCRCRYSARLMDSSDRWVLAASCSSCLRH